MVSRSFLSTVKKFNFGHSCTFQHGNQGVLVTELQDELDETGIINTIPEDRLDLLLEKADRDGDAYITFAEFINMVRKTSSCISEILI